MSETAMDIGGLKVRINRKGIKNIHLSVYPPEGRVIIACPTTTSDETLRLYLSSKIGWVKRQQKLLQEKDRQSPRKFVTGETHYLFGKAYRLKVLQVEGQSTVQIKGKSTIELHVHPGASRESKADLLKEYYRAQLKNVLSQMIGEWCSRISAHPEGWQVKAMKTKWGSCNSAKKTLLFNLELAKKPKTCIEYIVVHELVHLNERLHNERFVAYMDRFMPMWRRRKEELNSLPVAHVDWGY